MQNLLILKEIEGSIFHLDSLAFNNYVCRKNLIVHRLIRNGILTSGLDWNAIKQVKGNNFTWLITTLDVRPFCHEILLLLVSIHAHVSDISKELVQRVLSALFHCIGQDLLLSFRAIDQFNSAGIMQATLETEFLEHTLGSIP